MVVQAQATRAKRLVSSIHNSIAVCCGLNWNTPELGNIATAGSVAQTHVVVLHVTLKVHKALGRHAERRRLRRVLYISTMRAGEYVSSDWRGSIDLDSRADCTGRQVGTISRDDRHKQAREVAAASPQCHGVSVSCIRGSHRRVDDSCVYQPHLMARHQICGERAGANADGVRGDLALLVHEPGPLHADGFPRALQRDGCKLLVGHALCHRRHLRCSICNVHHHHSAFRRRRGIDEEAAARCGRRQASTAGGFHLGGVAHTWLQRRRGEVNQSRQAHVRPLEHTVRRHLAIDCGGVLQEHWAHPHPVRRHARLVILELPCNGERRVGRGGSRFAHCALWSSGIHVQ